MYRPDITGASCRLCGAPLPSRGLRRTCAQCGSVHFYPLYGLSRTIVLGAVGLFFLLVGLTVLLLAVSFMRGLDREAALAQQPSLRSSAEVAASPPKRTVMLEGRVSERNKPVYQQLVAYERDVDKGQPASSKRGRGSPNWMSDGRETPELLLELSDGSLRLASSICDLDGNLHILYAQEEGKSRRYQGLQAGDQVLVFGQVAAVRGEPVVSPSKIFVGNRAQLIADAGNDRIGVLACGAVLLVIWMGLGTILMRILWRHGESLGLESRR